MTTVYGITSAQAEARPVKPFLETFQYATDNMVVLPMIGKSGAEEILHSHFNDYDVCEKERKLNNNLGIAQFHVRPYQIDPVTGLNRFAQRDTSKIFASPKQRLKAIATSNKYPKYLATTGACTEPNYATGETVSAERRRLGGIAQRDHIIGGIIVDVIDKEKYLMRHIRSNHTGKFIDQGILYDGTKDPVWVGAEHLIVGDRHCGITDPQAKKATVEMIKWFKPKELWEHDFSDMHSICHHNKGKIGYLVQFADMYHNWNLEAEVKDNLTDLLELHDLMDGRRINIVYSNHCPGFLERYLTSMDFVEDVQNAKFAARLFSAQVQGENPYKAALEIVHGKPLPRNIVFLNKYSDERRYGVQLASHGHLGKNGGQGTTQSHETDFGKSVSGHSHLEEILRETFKVPTIQLMRLPWQAGGPSTSSHGNATLYHNGVVQLQRIIDGIWKV